MCVPLRPVLPAFCRVPVEPSVDLTSPHSMTHLSPLPVMCKNMQTQFFSQPFWVILVGTCLQPRSQPGHRIKSGLFAYTHFPPWLPPQCHSHHGCCCLFLILIIVMPPNQSSSSSVVFTTLLIVKRIARAAQRAVFHIIFARNECRCLLLVVPTIFSWLHWLLLLLRLLINVFGQFLFGDVHLIVQILEFLLHARTLLGGRRPLFQEAIDVECHLLECFQQIIDTLKKRGTIQSINVKSNLIFRQLPFFTPYHQILLFHGNFCASSFSSSSYPIRLLLLLIMCILVG